MSDYDMNGNLESDSSSFLEMDKVNELEPPAKKKQKISHDEPQSDTTTATAAEKDAIEKKAIEDLKRKLVETRARNAKEEKLATDKVRELETNLAKIKTTIRVFKMLRKKILDVNTAISGTEASKDILVVNELFDEFYKRSG